MKLKHSCFSFIALLFTLFHFSVGHAQRLPEEVMRFHKDHTENGLIFGSISFPREKIAYDGIKLNINYNTDDSKKRKKNSGKIKIGPTMLKARHDGELEGGKTYLFTMEKEPGQYNIPQLTLTIFKVLDHSPVEKFVTDFNIPFEVKKGEITYIGEIFIDEYLDKSAEIISVNDKFERDKNAMKNLQKMVNWESAVKSKLEITYH